jgi:Tfp pilus assembly protein PilF
VSAETSASWTEAALALRTGDTVAAEAALRRLAETDNAGTRDSAQLTLAQLHLSHGRAVEARGLLERLSRNGATPFIRRRASELLGR